MLNFLKPNTWTYQFNSIQFNSKNVLFQLFFSRTTFIMKNDASKFSVNSENISGAAITSKTTMGVLGVLFDSKLQQLKVTWTINLLFSKKN